MTGQEYKYAIETGQYPQFIYKYRPCDTNTLDALKNNYLWFSKLNDFNDPYDGLMRTSFEHTQNEFEAFVVLHKEDWTPQTLSQFYQNPKSFLENGLEQARKSVKVCCFSEQNDNILMWSHYANCHKGICLEFEYAENETNLFHTFRSVQYSRSYDCCNYFRCSQKYVEKMVFTKALDWSYEKEYRAAFAQLEGNQVFYSPSALRRIIFGCKTTEDYKNKVKAIAPNSVRYAECKLNEYHYKLEIVNE